MGSLVLSFLCHDHSVKERSGFFNAHISSFLRQKAKLPDCNINYYLIISTSTKGGMFQKNLIDFLIKN